MKQKSSGKSDKKQPGAKDLDRLTGILKKNVAEKKIAFKMKEKGGGTLFLCDVNQLKWVNEQHGHLAGDECLKHVAQILSYMIQPDDILGRHGGDEFAIFMPDCREVWQAEEICERIANRFRTNGRREKEGVPFSVTVAWALWQPGDTYSKLLERVDRELELKKPTLIIQGEQEDKEKDNYIKDAEKIRKELIEQIRKPGAYCQDYEAFKSIYRFLERGIIRSGQKACVILFTVVNEQGESLLPYEKDVLMEWLGDEIETSLRIGDVYTRYSSSQYLALVIDTTEGQADMIVDRIKARFLAGRAGNDILIHHCYELRPAKIVDWTEQDAEAEAL